MHSVSLPSTNEVVLVKTDGSEIAIGTHSGDYIICDKETQEELKPLSVSDLTCSATFTLSQTKKQVRKTKSMFRKLSGGPHR